MQYISATKKGLITGAFMIAISILVYYHFRSFENSLQFIIYSVYTAGIVWTLLSFSATEANNNKFGTYFNQGFKCFIVVTLMMVVFTYSFLQLHPEFKDEMAIGYRAELIKQGNYTPVEMDAMVAKSKEYYSLMLTSMAIFGYLIIGSLVTLITAGILISRKK